MIEKIRLQKRFLSNAKIMTDRQLTLEEIFALPNDSILTYFRFKNWPSRGFCPDRISIIIHYANDGWLKDEDRQLVRHSNFIATAQFPEDELIRKLQAQGVDVTALMTRFDLIRLFLSENDIVGQLFAFGSNRYGQLGPDDRGGGPEPIQVPEFRDTRIKVVSAGTFYTMVITEDGQLFAFGLNNYGQLGLGDRNDEDNIVRLPTQVPRFRDIRVKAVSTGSGWHTMVITENSQLFAFGRNEDGQLGLGDRNNRNDPIPIPRFRDMKVKAVSIGENHTMVITEDGQLLAFGSNEDGQLGVGDRDNRDEPTQVPMFENVRVKAVSAGGSGHTMVITETDQLFAFGNNEEGQLGLGHKNVVYYPTQVPVFRDMKVKVVSAGVAHTMVMTENGQLFAFGSNFYGQLGLGDVDDRSEPIQVLKFRDTKIKAVSASQSYTMVITEDEQLYAFGFNLHGQLGLDDRPSLVELPTQIPRFRDMRVKAVSAGNNHTMVIAN